jgi:hypothetical protein
MEPGKRAPSLIPDPLTRADCADPRQEAANKRAYEDLWAEAMQTLLSNGVAPASEDTFEQMKELWRTYGPRSIGRIFVDICGICGQLEDTRGYWLPKGMPAFFLSILRENW